MIRSIAAITISALFATLFSGVAFAQPSPSFYSPAASFTTSEIAAISSSSGASFTSNAGAVVVQPTLLGQATSAIALEVQSAQAAALSNLSFWGRLVAKITFKTAASRVAGGCAVGLIKGGLASTKEVTWFMKTARILTGCAAGIPAGLAAEFVAATVLAAGAPVWAGVAAGVVVMGAVTFAVDTAFANLWFDRAKARRELSQVGDYLQAPPVSQRINDNEYVSVGTSINPVRYMPGSPAQGLDLEANTAIVGYQSAGGSVGQRHSYVAPSPSH